MTDLTPFIDRAESIVAAAEIEPSVYRRYADRQGDADPYGCADAANILYTIARFPRDDRTRAAFVAGLADLRAPDGLWHEDTHHPIHTTAHCMAAMELFDAAPQAAIPALDELLDPARMAGFLEELPWAEEPWRASHRGAGIFAALVLAGQAGRDWQEAYAGWVTRQFDPATGLLRRGAVGPVAHGDTLSVFPHMAGTFHYLFNFECMHAPLPYPAALIDSCLAILDDGSFPLGSNVGFAEIDWVYCLNRARRQSDHRWAAGREALERMAERYCAYLLGIDPASNPQVNDLHSLFGAVCAVAELQQALPGRIRTERPLRLVLDRRPFI